MTEQEIKDWLFELEERISKDYLTLHYKWEMDRFKLVVKEIEAKRNLIEQEGIK